MATNTVPSIRDNSLYLGWGKEAAWLTGVVPTNYWRPLKGTKFGGKNQLTDIREGDTTVFETLSVKEGQWLEAHIVEELRPITSGCGLQAFCGTGSDAYTAPVYNSTLSATLVAGATQCVLVADPGNVGTKNLIFEGGYAATNAEAVTIDCTTRTGTGPWTVTLAAGATFKLGHNSGVTVAQPATHALTVQGTTYDPYSLELGIGTATYASPPARVLRAISAVAYSWSLASGPGGKVIEVTHDWYATGQKKLNAWQTPAWEQGNIAGSVMGSPMTHNQATGTWSLNNLLTGAAAVIRDFKIQMKRNTAHEDFITEQVTPQYFLPGGEVTIDGSFTIVLDDWHPYDQAIFATASPATNAVDGYIVGTEAFTATYQPDAANSFTFLLPNIRFAAPDPTYWNGGKALSLPVTYKAIKRPTDTTPVTITITNSQNSQY